MADDVYTLCSACSKDSNLVKAIEARGCPGTCTLCQQQRERMVPTTAVSNLFKALVRYYYAEPVYNIHWGGDEIDEVLAKPNPIIRTEHVSSGTCIPGTDIDLHMYTTALVEPAYPLTAASGVSPATSSSLLEF